MKFKMLYQASRDGWTASKRNPLINGKGGTLHVIKTNKGHIFGVYVSVPWKDYGSWKPDRKIQRFFFDKDKILANPYKMRSNYLNSYGVFFDKRSYFVDTKDFYIYDNCNKNPEAMSTDILVGLPINPHSQVIK